MTAMELRKRIQKRARSLSLDRLKAADEFLAYLEDREDNAATREMLAIPGFRAMMRRAERQMAAGKTVRLAKVRRDV